jgi:hypothetical protein
VATTAESYSVRRAPARAPLSTHPAFPAIVALWFAALLGIGSLVVPAALIERVIATTGLASAIPSAAPPLGFTARGGIALACAVAGALLGLGLARKVARAHAAEPRQRQVAQTRECRPISAHDELGEDGLGATPARSPKRRALAIAEDDARSTFLPTVPLPGDSTVEAATLAEDVTAQPAEAESDTLDLSDFADLEAADALGADDETFAAAPDPAPDLSTSLFHLASEPLQDQPMTDRSDSDTPNPFAIPTDRVDPLPFAAPSLRRGERAEIAEAEEPARAFEQSPAPRLAVIEDFDEPEAPEDDDRPLAELGLVQLAARLGASLERRRARRAAPVQTSPAPVPSFAGADDFEAAEADEATRAMAEFFGTATHEPSEEVELAPVAIVPSPLHAWSIEANDEADDEDFAASLSLPLTGAAASYEAFDEEDVADFRQEDPDESDYSSLLAMSNPFVRKPEFVRVEEPEDEAAAFEPVVTFPSPLPVSQGQAERAAARPFDPPPIGAGAAVRPTAPVPPRDPREAERNLRDALATLQRMGGAA